uniref:Uncharacterized protein n=1 Tax=Cacopsylla melanoneura TaxID=428564 RepID=A0A8D9BC36_9HEMI
MGQAPAQERCVWRAAVDRCALRMRVAWPMNGVTPQPVSASHCVIVMMIVQVAKCVEDYCVTQAVAPTLIVPLLRLVWKTNVKIPVYRPRLADLTRCVPCHVTRSSAAVLNH